MRPVLIGDIIAVARVLLAADESDWVQTADGLLHAAETADRYRLRFGRAHPDAGNGSLMAASAQRPQLPEPFPSDRRYLRALACTVDRLLASKLSFVSGHATLYDGVKSSCEDKGHGRDKSEDGDDRSGLAADL